MTDKKEKICIDKIVLRIEDIPVVVVRRDSHAGTKIIYAHELSEETITALEGFYTAENGKKKLDYWTSAEKIILSSLKKNYEFVDLLIKRP